MNVIYSGKFNRDVHKVHNRKLKEALSDKIHQIKKAKDITHITVLKLLDG